MDKESFPQISKIQVDALVELIPKELPSLLDTDREIWYSVGRQSVVDLILEIYKMQNETIFNK
jgi:hypothetical protein|tara:strand:+ start:934 stop:1122 length:189 start_codon:yes stop_codon:yes gene_type:complete